MSVGLLETSSEYLYTANSGLLSGLSAMSAAGWEWFDSLSDPAHRQSLLQAWWRIADDSLHPQALLRCAGTAVQCFVYNGANQFGGNIGKTASTGQWHHLAMTYDGSTLIGYLDGAAGGTTYSPNGTIGADTNNLAIGKHGVLYNDGNVTDRGIWNVALTAAEIYDMYNSRLACSFFPVGLIHHWPLIARGRTGGLAAAANDFDFRDPPGSLTALVGNSAGWDPGRDPPINFPDTNM